MNGIGLKIKTRREELGITQDMLAKMVGYKHKSSINKIESGSRDVPRKTLILFANALDVSVEWLLSDDSMLDEDVEFLKSIPPLHPKDELPPELEAVNTLLHIYGIDIFKTGGNYFISECGKIEEEELNDLINTIAICAKNAADTLIAKKTKEFRDYLKKDKL